MNGFLNTEIEKSGRGFFISEHGQSKGCFPHGGSAANDD